MTRLSLAVGVSLFVLAGCSFGRATHTESTGPDEGSQGTSITLKKNSAEAALDRGQQDTMEGKFKEAEDAFTDAYHDENASPGVRAAALYDLGKLYSNILNPGRDAATSKSYFDRLLEEYPDSTPAKALRAERSSLGSPR